MIRMTTRLRILNPNHLLQFGQLGPLFYTRWRPSLESLIWIVSTMPDYPTTPEKTIHGSSSYSRNIPVTLNTSKNSLRAKVGKIINAALAEWHCDTLKIEDAYQEWGDETGQRHKIMVVCWLWTTAAVQREGYEKAQGLGFEMEGGAGSEEGVQLWQNKDANLQFTENLIHKFWIYFQKQKSHLFPHS